MADLGAPIAFGVGNPTPTAAGLSFAGTALNNSTHYIAFVFQSETTSAITTLLIRQASVTGTAPTYRVSLEGVDGSGNPDGSIKSSGNAYADITPTAGNNNTIRRLTLTSSYTPTRGETLAIVIRYQTGTIDGSNNATFSTQAGTTASSANFPYTIWATPTASKRNSYAIPFGYATASRVYGTPIQSGYNNSAGIASTPDEMGCAWIVPATATGTYQVVGVRLVWFGGTGNTIRVQLYEGTTVLQSIASKDTDHFNGSGLADIYFTDSTLATLNAGTRYRIGIRSNSSTTLNVFGEVVNSANDLAAWQGGTDFQLCTRTDDGAWTDGTTTHPYVWPLLQDMTVGASGIAYARAFAGM